MAAARDGEEIASIRKAVRALCADFPGEYWLKLDRERAPFGMTLSAAPAWTARRST